MSQPPTVALPARAVFAQIPASIEDYCYPWLLICSKYDLVMTEDEIALCEQYILEALSNGEPVEHLGGHYEI